MTQVSEITYCIGLCISGIFIALVVVLDSRHSAKNPLSTPAR